MIKICSGCGIGYDANHRGRKYCSWDCYKSNKPSALVEKVCQVCGKKYTVWRHRQNTSRHCSWECNHEALRGDGPRVDGHSMYEHICQLCGKTILEQAHDKIRIYCSNDCARRARDQRIAKRCLTCDQSFKVKRSRVENGRGQYCSKHCYYAGEAFRKRLRRTNARGGKRPDLDNVYFRSSWEANYARILNHLMNYYIIKDWQFEAETFDLGDAVYIPDFKIIGMDDVVAYHEVKGHMTAKAKQKLAKMEEQYPDVPLVLITQDRYEALKDIYSERLPNWE